MILTAFSPFPLLSFPTNRKMESEANSSLLEHSLTQDSVQTGTQKSKQPRSAATTCAHTRTAHDNEDSRYKYCIHCTTSPYGTSVTTNMRAHLQSKHGVIVDRTLGQIQATTIQQLQQPYLQAMSTGQTEVIDTRVFRKFLNQDVIDEALVALVVVRNLPFHLVEWPEFHTLCQALNPESHDFLPTAHSEIPKKIKQSWQAHKDIVRKKLQSAISSIHLSLDVWTSPNRLLLLGICAHFVDSQEKHLQALLALRTIANHSGNEQFTALLPVLKDYGIVRKLGSIVCDNASSNDTLCRTIEAYLLKEEDIEWNSKYRRVRCTGHIINLAVQAFLFHDLIEIEQLESYDRLEGERIMDEDSQAAFRLLGPLGKLHNIIVYIRSSASRTKHFQDLAGRMIPLDNRTGWNNWYQMLVVADQKAGAIDTYTKDYSAVLQPDYLSSIDWERLRTIKDFLQPFHRATLETEGDRATLDHVSFTMDILVQYFQDSLVSRYLYKKNNTNIVR